METMRMMGNKMCQPDFDLLMDEVRCINAYLGTVGVLDALMYIQAHESEYEGTAMHRQFRQFMAQGRKMFATKEPA